MIARELLGLGILAGGRAERLGGIDKARARYAGTPLVERVVAAFAAHVGEILLSSNRDPADYAHLPARVVADRVPGHPGPLAGVDALLSTCSTPWLVTVPVDLRRMPGDLVERLCLTGEHAAGAVAEDAEGLQPLVALYRVEPARTAVADALAAGELAVHRLVRSLGLAVMHAPDLRFGNLNTPGDFLADRES